MGTNSNQKFIVRCSRAGVFYGEIVSRNGQEVEMSYPGADLFRWHNLLTGSCEMGRRAFCRDRGIDIDTASFTVKEFVKLTCDSYGKEVIRKLAERLSIMI